MFQQEQSTSTIAYKLFVYREELRKSQGIKLSRSKLNLTEELVSYSVNHIMEYAREELSTINRQITFTQRLKNRVERMRQMQRMVSATQSRAAKNYTTSL